MPPHFQAGGVAWVPRKSKRVFYPYFLSFPSLSPIGHTPTGQSQRQKDEKTVKTIPSWIDRADEKDSKDE